VENNCSLLPFYEGISKSKVKRKPSAQALFLTKYPIKCRYNETYFKKSNQLLLRFYRLEKMRNIL